jgi:hypothetical protein
MKEQFINTFQKYMGAHIQEIYLPKLKPAALSRCIIYHLQMAADAADIVIRSIDIQEVFHMEEYHITVNGLIKIELSLVEKEVANG